MKKCGGNPEGNNMSNGVWGVIIACGKSEEISPEAETAFLHLGDRPVLIYSLLAFEECSDIDGVVLVARKDRVENIWGMASLFGCSKLKHIVAGTTQWTSSVQNGLKAIGDDASVVVIHESSRPCVDPSLISQTVKAAKRHGSGVAACLIDEPVKVAEKGLKASKSLPSGAVWAVQTPQAYKLKELSRAIESAKKKKMKYDDESSVYGRAHKNVHIVPSSRKNMKIMEADDMFLISSLIRV